MAVTGDLAGQPITLDNAASEATLLRIESIMASQSTGPNSAAQQAAAAQAATNFARETGRAVGDVQNLGAGAGTGAVALSGLSRSAGQFSRMTTQASRQLTGFGQSISRSNPFDFAKSVIQAGGSALGTVLEHTASKIPVLGNALGAVGKAAAGLATFALGALVGALQTTVQEFNKVQQAGAIFGGDLMRFRNISNDAGLSMAQYNGVLQRAGEAMASFGGGTTRGAQEFAKASKTFQAGYSDQMLRMGLDYESQGVAVAEYMERLQLSGHALGEVGATSGDVAAGAARLAKQQKMLATLNGESIESQKQRQKQMRTDAAFQAAIQGMSVQQRDEMQALITQFPHLAQSIKETIVTGDAVSAEAIMAVQAAGTQGQIVMEGVRNIAEGADPTAQVSNVMANIEANSAVIQSELNDSAEIVKMGILGVNSSFVNAYTEQFLPLQSVAVKAGAKTFSSVEADMALLEQSSSAAQQAVVKIAVDFQNAQREISDGVSALLDSSFGEDIANLITLPTRLMAGATQAILPDAETRVAPIITPPNTPTPTELEMDAPTAPLTGQELGRAFGLGDVIQSQATNTNLTVDAINSLKQEFRRRLVDLAEVIGKIQ